MRGRRMRSQNPCRHTRGWLIGGSIRWALVGRFQGSCVTWHVDHDIMVYIFCCAVKQSMCIVLPRYAEKYLAKAAPKHVFLEKQFRAHMIRRPDTGHCCAC